MREPAAAGGLPSLYQELILDHYRRPRNKGALENPSVTVSMYNPVCGDEIELQLTLEEGRLAAIRFGGHGCSISQASASMMTLQTGGRGVEEVGGLVELFKLLMHGSTDAAADRRLGDLRALQGVARFPVRIKCALLAWNALEEALRVHAIGEGDAGQIVVDDAEGLPAGEPRDLLL
ncbi:MAG: Fe-S cluster assembly sulfur transfer protein SufU [Gemmatimonadota bacterium]